MYLSGVLMGFTVVGFCLPQKQTPTNAGSNPVIGVIARRYLAPLSKVL